MCPNGSDFVGVEWTFVGDSITSEERLRNAVELSSMSKPGFSFQLSLHVLGPQLPVARSWKLKLDAWHRKQFGPEAVSTRRITLTCL